VNVDLIIFDLDGTLADTLDDLAASVNHALRTASRPCITTDQVRRHIGDGARILMERSLETGTGREPIEDALQSFLRYYGEHLLERTALYPGVEETLAWLAPRMSLAVLSNKSEVLTRRVLKGLGIMDRFRGVYGGDSFSVRKPDPAGFRRVMNLMTASPFRTLVVGDSANDILGGRSAGARTCGVVYGYRPDEVRAHSPDVIIDRFPDLQQVLGWGQ